MKAITLECPSAAGVAVGKAAAPGGGEAADEAIVPQAARSDAAATIAISVMTAKAVYHTVECRMSIVPSPSSGRSS